MTVLSLASSLGAFYLSTWEEYHTGTLYLSYFSGPVEGIIMLVFIHTISGIFGKLISHAGWREGRRFEEA